MSSQNCNRTSDNGTGCIVLVSGPLMDRYGLRWCRQRGSTGGQKVWGGCWGSGHSATSNLDDALDQNPCRHRFCGPLRQGVQHYTSACNSRSRLIGNKNMLRKTMASEYSPSYPQPQHESPPLPLTMNAHHDTKTTEQHLPSCHVGTPESHFGFP